MSLNIFESWLWSFMGIVIESLPFILIGSVISSIIQFYISEELLNKILPKNRIVGFLFAGLSGIFFPICECAIVPITRSLIKKGLPMGIGITFMLAVPIVNPVVIMSTYYAFPNNISIVIIRTLGGLFAALLIGVIVDLIYLKRKSDSIFLNADKNISCECCTISRNYNYSKLRQVVDLIYHASTEFLNISIYFIFGAFISSIFNIMLSNQYLANLKANNILGIFIMMVVAFVLSLCSEADAFVAKGFIDNFGVGPLSAFLILGPMMDLKNTFLCFGLFKKKFVFTLISLIFLVVLCIGLFVVTLGF